MSISFDRWSMLGADAVRRIRAKYSYEERSELLSSFNYVKGDTQVSERHMVFVLLFGLLQADTLPEYGKLVMVKDTLTSIEGTMTLFNAFMNVALMDLEELPMYVDDRYASGVALERLRIAK